MLKRGLWEAGSSGSVKKGRFCLWPCQPALPAATPVLSFSLSPARRLSQSDSSKWGHLQKLPLGPDNGTQNLAQACERGRWRRGPVGGPWGEDSCGLLWQARPCPGTGEVNVNSGGGPPGFSRVEEKAVQGLLSTRCLNFTAGVSSSLLPQKGRGQKRV